MQIFKFPLSNKITQYNNLHVCFVSFDGYRLPLFYGAAISDRAPSVRITRLERYSYPMPNQLISNSIIVLAMPLTTAAILSFLVASLLKIENVINCIFHFNEN